MMEKSDKYVFLNHVDFWMFIEQFLNPPQCLLTLKKNVKCHYKNLQKVLYVA